MARTFEENILLIRDIFVLLCLFDILVEIGSVNYDSIIASRFSLTSFDCTFLPSQVQQGKWWTVVLYSELLD